MDYAGWIFGMMLKVALLRQEEPIQEPPALRPPPAPAVERPAPPATPLRFTWSSANPEHLNRGDLASWHHAGGDLLRAAVGFDSRDALWLKLVRIGAAGAAQLALDFTVHEFGHVSSFSRAGVRGLALGSEERTLDEWSTPDLGFFLSGAFGGPAAPITVSASDWEEIDAIFAGRPRAYAEFMILTKAGGLNQEQMGLAELGGRIAERGASPLDLAPYVLAATSTLRYPGSLEDGDLDDYLERLEELGVSSSLSTLRLLSAARFLSGSAVALMGAVLLDAGGLPRLDLGEAGSVAWPEFESYLSRYGPTLKVSVASQLFGLELQPSYERSFAGGRSTHEAGLKAGGALSGWLRVDAAAYAGDEGGRWLEAGVEARPLGWLTIGVGLVSASGYTIHREVYGANLPMIETRETGLRISVGLAWSF